MRILMLLFVLSWASPVLAEENCIQVPPEVANYVKMQDGWTLLTEADLIPDQQMLWDQDHAHDCPGLAAANLSGKEIAYAVAMVQHPAEGVIYERLVLIEGYSPAKDLAGPEEMDFPSVVYSVGPGRAFDFKIRKYVTTPHDSIVYEHWNSITKTFFLSGGKIEMVQSSY